MSAKREKGETKEGSRYDPIVKIAQGGMATVFLGAMKGAHGFQQLVALKRPHPHLVGDPKLLETLLAEARLAARIHHANVVDVRDVESLGDSVQLVMDYVEGASLGDLVAASSEGGPKLEPGVAARVVIDACAGLHAAHELLGDDGRPLGFVHRDVSPQNILVGLDGVARVTDFGIAKSRDAGAGKTTEGVLKGKLGYMAPEYVRGAAIDLRADVFAMGVVLWEALAQRRLFRGSNEAETIEKVVRAEVPSIDGAPPALLAVAARALAKDRDARFASAEEMRAALEATGAAATHAEVGRHVKAVAGDALEARRRAVREHEEAAARSGESVTPPPPRESRRPTRGRRAIVALSISALCVAAAATGLRVLAARSPAPASPAASAAPPPSTVLSALSALPPAASPPAPAASLSSPGAAGAPAATRPPASRPPPAPMNVPPTATHRAPPNPYP